DSEPTENRDGADRMMALLVTKDQVGWSFKLVGPAKAMADDAEAFQKLARSLKFPAADAPTWELPEGWEQLPASGMRYATLLPHPPAKQPEVSIVRLPPQEVLSNVNRWRQQMGLKPVTESELETTIERLQIDGVEAVLVDITGQLAADQMMPPFMTKTPGVSPPFADGPDTASAAPPPVSAPDEAESDAELTFSVPDHWNAADPGPMRFRLFVAVDGSSVTEISISKLPVAGADLLANVNRWRGQIGANPWSSDELTKNVRDRKIGGVDAQYIELPGPEQSDAKSIIAAICHRDQTAWFFKLMGLREQVEVERPHFEAFLDSIQWSP
ncbi:MAG TPA: hypothetical protein VIY86_11065, partial [Pirellulaceae bacterium]